MITGQDITTALQKILALTREVRGRGIMGSTVNPIRAYAVGAIEQTAARALQDPPLASILASRDIDRLVDALEKSVKLQSHYAELLNGHDGGERLMFSSAEEWLERLRVT